MFATLMQVRAAGFAQQVSINQKNITLKQVFNEINKQTGYNILWSSKNIRNDKVIDVDLNKATIQQALTECLKGSHLTYTIDNKTIVIRESETAVKSEVAKPIKGKITDDKGEPLVGATIKVKGSSKGSVTDATGSFTLDASAGDVLVVSYLGYTTEEVTVGNQAVLSIVLKEAQNELTRVVVTALGIKKQARSLSYNVQEINGEELNRVKDVNFVNALAGKVAGATINSSSAGPGGSTRVVLRGTKSISNNNNALYVVDGIPMPSLSSGQPGDVFSGAGQTGDAISNINPEDIESATVLTGPSAAALYGNRGANGVIVITTKKGIKGSFSATVSNNTTFTSPFVMPRFQNTYGSEAGSFSSWGEKLSTPTSYQPKDFFQTGVNTTTALSISTGTEKSQTYFSAAAVNANGIIHNNDLERYNFSFRNTTKFLNDKLNLDVSAMYVKLKEQNMLAQGQYFNPLIPIYLFPRGDDIRKYQAFERYNPTRNFKTQFWPFGDQGFQMQNPYWITERDLFENNKDRYMLTANLQYNINSWMNITGRVKMDQNTSINERKYYASTAGLFASDAGAYYRYNYNTRQTYADLLLNINKTVKDFSISANVGASLTDDVYDETSFGGNLQSVPNLFTYGNVNLSNARPLQTGYHEQLQAAFATAQVGYKSKVYLDLTGRTDWASPLAYTSTKAIFYPSVGLSGVMTDIFDIKSNVLSFLKARVSYSEVGNPPTRFLSNPTYPLTNGYPQTTTYLAASNLTPERTKSYEAGLNFVFWNNKVKLDVTAYSSSTYNQLFNPSLSPSSGYSSFYVNAGRIDNKGIEVTASLNQKLGPVKWTSNLVYSLNRNKIKQLLPAYQNQATGETVSIDSLDMGGTTSYKMILVKGGSMGDVYVNTLKTDEHGYIYVNSSSQTVATDQNRYVKAGNANPRFNLGWRNGFNYKGVDVSFLVTARIGGVGVSVTQAVMDAYGVSETSALARDNGGAVVNGYKIPAQPYYQTIGGGTSGVGSMYVYSATNVRLGEASVGYTIPLGKYAKWVKGLNVSVIGRNLFMFYNKAPYDPENTANTGTYYQGIDYFMQPSLRSLGFSARLQF
ncbi:SusC/RagA family TonB-linked outer membrane protein [Mucilaginibacter sp. PAMB04274]|uniref:SusC/RagA family TonB-linked outer membrane protein n=1 Tax=Mucilaginibacter sp. PAMB04274 TaxID=3138568 RepID=UPI0031F68089